MSVFHPDLKAGRFIPRLPTGPLSTRMYRLLPQRPTRDLPGVSISQALVSGRGGSPDVALRILRPARLYDSPTPLLLWMHGGGLTIGDSAQDDKSNAEFVRWLGIVVASVEYRLAPETRGPAAVEDCYLALQSVVANAASLGVDPTRIAIGGSSAGGGLAAALAQMARDRGEIPLAFQLLVYPMLDDRTVLRNDVDATNMRVWTPNSNRYGWTSYLQQAPGSPNVPPYTVPARTTDLSGLPPAWIGVGTLDLFHDEDLQYASRLQRAGVDAETNVVPGAFHGFDVIFSRTDVSKNFRSAQADALHRALIDS